MRYNMLGNIPQFGEKPEGPYRERPSAYAIIYNEGGKILSVKVGEIYHLPGGGIDPGEDSGDAAIREAREEAGCEMQDIMLLCKAN